jgi:RNA polymerase sigma factor (sigma-70 family)
MKKYNIQNYIRYKTDVKTSIANLEGKFYDEYTKDELIIKFLPLVENLARKFSTSDQASGILSINDLIQIGNEALIKAVNKIDWSVIDESPDVEKTLKSFLSKRIKGAIRRRIDINKGGMRIPEHKLSEIRKNPDNEDLSKIFITSMFTSLDNEQSSKTNTYKNDDNTMSFAQSIEDDSTPYNIDLMNAYLMGIMKQYLSNTEYEVIRLTYGMDCEKHSAKEIAVKLNITGVSNYVRISEIKKAAIDKLIANVDSSQVIDFL